MNVPLPRGPRAVMRAKGLEHVHRFVSRDDADALGAWATSVLPIFESRHSGRYGARRGQDQRTLLRPVYWLGGWQHACRGYYRPPDYVADRVMQAEPFPDVLARLTTRIEERARALFDEVDCPPKWRLNTCLVNYYGLSRSGERWVDRARVGGHKDHEPGPVASISLGAKALFQFATKPRGPEDKDVVLQGWLRDRSMVLFGTERWKSEVFHRVPRVAREDEHVFPLPYDDFRVRRVNFTLRYVPEEHIVTFGEMSAEARDQVREYVAALSEGSTFFADALRGERS